MLSMRCNSTLNHEKIGKHPKRIAQINPFINKYNWKGIDYHQKMMTGKMLRKKKCNYLS